MFGCWRLCYGYRLVPMHHMVMPAGKGFQADRTQILLGRLFVQMVLRHKIFSPLQLSYNGLVL
jgi:hypothetical protein